MAQFFGGGGNNNGNPNNLTNNTGGNGGGGGPNVKNQFLSSLAGKLNVSLDQLNVEAQAQAQKLPHYQDATKLGGLRVANRNISQLLEQTIELERKTSRSTDGGVANVHAQMFHASNGVDVARYGRNLDKLKLPTSIDPPSRVGETSVDAFLKNERHNALNIAITKAQSQTRQEYHAQHLRKMKDDWNREKNALRELLSAEVPVEAIQDFSVINTTAHGANDVSGPFSTTSQVRSTMDSDSVVFARVVWYWVEAIMDDTTFDLVGEFKAACSQLDDDRKDDIARAWDVVRAMSVMSQGQDVFQIKARESQSIWLSIDDQPSRIIATHIRNAKNHLEHRYAAFIKSHQKEWYVQFVEDSIRSQNPGMKISIKEDHPQERIWAQIYFCLRAGRVDDAREASSSLVGDVDDDEMHYLLEALNAYHNSSAASSHFPIPGATHVRDFDRKQFKRSVYMVLGLCVADAASSNAAASSVAKTAEDWLWFKLNLVRSDGKNQQNHGKYLEEEFQKLQHDIYEGTNKGDNFDPLLYFELLLLTAQFERAIEYLRSKQLIKFAVHFALPLEHVGLLHTTNHANKRQTLATNGNVNFGHLVQCYARSFHHSNVAEAMRYYYLLRNYRWESAADASLVRPMTAGDSLFVHCVTHMVMKTKEWKMVLGDYNENGYKAPALVDRYEHAWVSESAAGHGIRIGDGKRQIIRSVAHVAETDGHLYDAIRLYDLADDRASVLHLLNQKLSEGAANRFSKQDETIFDFAKRVTKYERYACDSINDPNRQQRDLLDSMLHIVDFFALFFQNKFKEAVRKIVVDLKDKRFIPANADAATFEGCVLAFDHMPHEVLRNLPQLLLCTMNCLSMIYHEMKTQVQQYRVLNPLADGGKSHTLQELRDHAKALVTYAGRINYRMPGDTNAKLIRMEVAMMA